MNAPTEKDYIDSKLQTVVECLNAEARSRQIGTEAHLEKIEQGLQSFRQELNTLITQVERHLEYEVRSIRNDFNAKLTQMEANFQHALQLSKEEFNSRFNQVEANSQRDLQIVRAEFNEKLTKLETSIHRSLLDAVKWMIGSMVALTAISITVSSTLYLRTAQVQTSAVPSPQPGLSASGAKTLSANLTLAAQSPQLVATHPATTPMRTVH